MHRSAAGDAWTRGEATTATRRVHPRTADPAARRSTRADVTRATPAVDCRVQRRLGRERERRPRISLLHPDPHQHLARADKAVLAFESRQLALDFAPRIGALGLG